MKKSMFVKCLHRDLFSDSVTIGKIYKVLHIKDSGVCIICDDDMPRYIFETLFTKPLTLYVFDK